MKQQVNPIVAALIVVIALAIVWFVYTRVLTGKETGTIGPPSGVSMPPPPGGPGSMPEKPQTKETDKAAAPGAGAGDQAADKPAPEKGR